MSDRDFYKSVCNCVRLAIVYANQRFEIYLVIIMDWMLVFASNSHVEILDLQYIGVRRWDLWEMKVKF